MPACVEGESHCPADRHRAYNLWSMSVIEIRNLQKSYRVYQKQEGLWAAFAGLFNRQYREVQAVRGIDLDGRAGRIRRLSRAQRRRQDDDAQAALRRDQSHRAARPA